MPNIGRLSKVRRLTSPPVAETTNKSFTTPAMVPRMNATFEPSGENMGLLSRASSGGDVSRRVLKSLNDKNPIQECGLLGLPSVNAKVLPSGDQLMPGYSTGWTVCTIRSVPPRAGITKMPVSFSKNRAKAICRASGDHVGQQSSELVVRRRDFSPPTTAV